MSAKPHEIQGTEAWLEYRRTRGGASEVAALFGESPFMPRNVRELYEVKTGQREVYVNDAMRHGNRNEPAARAKLEDMLGEALEPQVVEHRCNPRIIASLDGQTMDGETIIEIKCPPKGRESKAWKQVEDNGKPDHHYWLQIQQQLACSGAKYCLFAVYDANADDMITTQVHADPEWQVEIVEAWETFLSQLDTGTPPEPERKDAAWRKAAEKYRLAKEQLEAAREAELVAKAELEKLAGEDSARGCGVAVSRYYVKGSVDYKKAIPADIDLEQYRKPGRWQTRITIDKEAT
jgi:putative phage-type endonuclease